MKYEEAKRLVQNLEREQQQAEGALSEALKRLEEEFQCDSLEQAQELLERLVDEESELRERFEGEMRKFVKRYRNKLED